MMRGSTFGGVLRCFQWLFLVPLLYTTYILPSGGLYATYHLLGEPETTIDVLGFSSDLFGIVEVMVKGGLESSTIS